MTRPRLYCWVHSTIGVSQGGGSDWGDCTLPCWKCCWRPLETAQTASFCKANLSWVVLPNPRKVLPARGQRACWGESAFGHRHRYLLPPWQNFAFLLIFGCKQKGQSGGLSQKLWLCAPRKDFLAESKSLFLRFLSKTPSAAKSSQGRCFGQPGPGATCPQLLLRVGLGCRH